MTLLARFFLLLIVCMPIAACNKTKTTKPTTTATASTQVAAEDLVQEKMDREIESQAITGLAQAKSDTELTAETERVDPAVDGWNTETFNENATAQLKKLAKWLEKRDRNFPELIGPSLTTTELRPANVETKFEDTGFQVSRWSAKRQKQGEASKSDFQKRLRELLPGNEDVHAEFKIIGIEVTDATTNAHVRVHLSGANSKFRFQQNAAWKSSWEDVESDHPKLNSIELLEFEEVQAPVQQLFADRTAAVLVKEPSFEKQLMYPLDHWRDRLDWRFGWQIVGAHGLAIGDANGDGLDDVYYLETGGLPNRLLIQQPDGTVRDVSRSAGVDIIEPTQSALFIDLDNDGDQDLVASVSRFMVVFENDGAGKFTRHPVVQTSSLLRSLVAVDYNNDRLLDVYACGYSLRSPDDSVGLGRPLPYHDANNGGASFLLRNQGGFRFADVTKDVGLDVNNRRFSYAAAWEDFDSDGDLDLYVANDFGRNNLYQNTNSKFKDIAAEAGVQDIAAGMSVSWGDYNRDGHPDLYVGNMFSSAGNRIAYQRQFRQDIDDETRAQYQRHARGNTLFENAGDGTFRDVSLNAGVTEARWAWGSNFADINNDGWQDLLVGNGMVTGTDDSGDL